MSKSITSMQNSLIKLVKELQSKKSKRKKEGLFIIEGIRAVSEIPTKAKVRYFITTPELSKAQLPNLVDEKWMIVSEEIYKAISETQSPQGAMAVVEIPEMNLKEILEEGCYLLLENLQDPGNLGTIIRSAHAFNVKGIFMTKGCVDLFSPKVVRSTMSSLFYVPIVIDKTIEDYVPYLKEQQAQLIVTDLDETALPINKMHYDKKAVLVIGNEGNGISKEIKAAADATIMIPMPGGCESLNASIAASICMYEVFRQAQG